MLFDVDASDGTEWHTGEIKVTVKGNTTRTVFPQAGSLLGAVPLSEGTAWQHSELSLVSLLFRLELLGPQRLESLTHH